MGNNTESKNKSAPKWLSDFDDYMGDEEVTVNSSEDFEKAFEDSMASSNLAGVGEIHRGKIVAVGAEFVTVDIGAKSEGFIPVAEFKSHDGNVVANVGEDIDVFVSRIKTEGNFVLLSKNKAEMIKAWDRIVLAEQNNTTVLGTVTGKIKGGLTVDIDGITAFIPASQIDAKPSKNLDAHIGKKYAFNVVKCSRKKGNLVLSRKEIAEGELAEKKSATMNAIKEGEIVSGTVRNLMDYGAFVDIGGIDGLLHIADLSWKKVKHPSEVIKVGSQIKVKVLKIEKEKEKVSLGLKQTLPNPWDSVAKKYPVGHKVKGKVVSVKEYGAFVEIEDGVEGLIHVSEMSWTQKVKNASKIVNVGDFVETQVLGVDLENKKISLGLKQLVQNPWDVLSSKYKAGTKVEGTIKNVADFGIFVDIGEGIDGMIHVSDLEWSFKKGNTIPQDKFKKGDKISAIVLSVDKAAEKFSLGLKQLEENPWKLASKKYPVGTIIEGVVSKVVDFGAFVKLEEHIEGLIYISELSEQKVQKPSEVIKMGDNVKVVVTAFDEKDKKISLSIKQRIRHEERAEIEAYSNQESEKMSFGNVFGDKLKAAIDKKSK